MKKIATIAAMLLISAPAVAQTIKIPDYFIIEGRDPKGYPDDYAFSRVMVLSAKRDADYTYIWVETRTDYNGAVTHYTTRLRCKEKTFDLHSSSRMTISGSKRGRGSSSFDQLHKDPVRSIKGTNHEPIAQVLCK